MVITICIHTVFFGAQLSLIFYYYVCEHTEHSLYQKIKRMLIPTAIVALAYGITESVFTGVFWRSNVLHRGIGSLTTFWLAIRVTLTIAYSVTIAIGLIPQSYIRLPSTPSLPLQFAFRLPSSLKR